MDTPSKNLQRKYLFLFRAVLTILVSCHIDLLSPCKRILVEKKTDINFNFRQQEKINQQREELEKQKKALAKKKPPSNATSGYNMKVIEYRY